MSTKKREPSRPEWDITPYQKAAVHRAHIAKAERAVIEAAMADWKARDLNEDTSALHYEGIWNACAALDKLRKGTP